MRRAIFAAFFLATTAPALAAGEWEVSADVALEARAFWEDPQFPEQFEGVQPSVAVTPDIRWESDSGRIQAVMTPFLRLDGQDDERSHFDMREAYVRYVGDDWEILAGAAKVFWGVAESRHLVDIINQTDAVEDIDEEDKLGQPMVKLSFLKNWGQVDLFVMPYFRERTFPGREGRLRTPFPVGDDALYEDGDEQETLDVAARYSNYFGDWDVGVSVFHGVSREPRLLLDAANGVFVPFYDNITQVGLDVQYTKDAWLWKFEGIVREGQGDAFGAFVGGVEYTVYQIAKSNADLGLLAEYLYDDRDMLSAPPTTLENDVFVGTRLALNDVQDTSVLAGAIVDAENGSTGALVEAERRLGQNWVIELESRIFFNVDPEDFTSAFAEDDNATLRLTRYF